MKLRHPVWILLLLFCCCHKDQPSPVVSVPFTFTTTYDSILTCTPNSTKILFFNVMVLSGTIDTNPITYTITNMPANTTVIPATQTVTLVQGGIFTFNIGNVPPGNDTVSFTISSSANGTENHKIILKVNAPSDFAAKLAGTYPASYDYCTPSDSIYLYSAVTSAVADTPHLLKIRNIKNLGLDFTVTAWISTNVTIPYQSVGSYKIWGSGTYTHDNPPHDTVYQMIIYDTLVSGLDTERCIIHLQH